VGEKDEENSEHFRKGTSLPVETGAGLFPNIIQKCYYFSGVARIFYGRNIVPPS
jgi:hypothetical protein